MQNFDNSREFRQRFATRPQRAQGALACLPLATSVAQRLRRCKKTAAAKWCRGILMNQERAIDEFSMPPGEAPAAGWPAEFAAMPLARECRGLAPSRAGNKLTSTLPLRPGARALSQTRLVTNRLRRALGPSSRRPAGGRQVLFVLQQTRCSNAQTARGPDCPTFKPVGFWACPTPGPTFGPPARTPPPARAPRSRRKTGMERADCATRPCPLS